MGRKADSGRRAVKRIRRRLPAACCPLKRVTDGTRTRDVQDHNLALYQLSYGHRYIEIAFY